MRRSARLLAWTALALCLVLLAVFAATLTVAPAADDLSARVHRFALDHHVRRLRLAAISPLLREAVVATEDERFYSHGGVDLIGILRAIPYDFSHFSLAQGASTIPEQLGKILYLNSSDHSLWRKLEDVAIGMRLGRNYTHEQVLDAYLNVVYLGEGSYGVATASRHYFHRSAVSLTLAQASLLAGLIRAPSRYAPTLDPQAARQRQLAVLRAMVRNGYTTTSEAAIALSRPLQLTDGVTLPPLLHVSLAPGAPFDWAELAFAIVLLGLAVAAFQAARTLSRDPSLRRLLQAGSLILVLSAMFAAAHSIQVV
jgi:membrane peptidoglycan carboxypeptidase